MPEDTAGLEYRAIELAKRGDFGIAALETNRELTRLAPANQGAWTRLGRCCLEQKQFEEAAAALNRALELNPSNNIAKSLQQEVVRRRASQPVRSDAASGFTPQDFYTLGHLSANDAAHALGPKLETLLLSINEQRTAARMVDARNRAGLNGSKLFRRNSYHAGDTGHVFAFHHGGRWEPQINLGIFSGSHWGADCLRVGIGFNMTSAGRDTDRDSGQTLAIGYFERFQQQLASTWRGHVLDWMEKTGGFIQYGDRGPALELLPRAAVDWIVKCRNPGGIGWVFVGRWLFMEKPADAQTLSEMRKLVLAVEETLAALFPLWVSVY